MKALESRTLQSQVVAIILSVIVAGLIELIPEFAEHQEFIKEMFVIGMVSLGIRFGAPGILVEILKAWKGENDSPPTTGG